MFCMLSLTLGAVNSKHRGRIMLQAGLMSLWWGTLDIGADGTEGSGLLLAGPGYHSPSSLLCLRS